ncbi:MAG: hypothetical protein Q9N32_01420 [Gammaproteobacteria bacterium]|nr:hypothetical protein [Gammaproteobacteria bacterium]
MSFCSLASKPPETEYSTLLFVVCSAAACSAGLAVASGVEFCCCSAFIAHQFVLTIFDEKTVA